ncbi:MAG: glycosyltransferase family 4 protein [Chthoniobacterales bacterium]|nr:glycosyltransferase family 4 protein [Chthoniobacterales bacterium]
MTRFPKGQMRLYRHCARLQAPSRVVRDAIVSEVPQMRDRVVMIPNPRPDSISTTAASPRGRERRIIYVGRVHPEKGVHLLIEAFVRLSEAQREGWKLVIIGPAATRFGGGGETYESELARLAASAGDAIEFRGAIFDPAELEREFRSATLFVYPSLAEQGETFGLAPLEAMAQACPVLVSDLACFRDFIEEGRTGFIFDHRAAEPVVTLSTRLAALMADELLREQVGAAGYQKAEEYSIHRVADQFLADFETVNGES